MSSSEQREHTRFPKKLSVDVHVFVLPASQTQAGYEAHGQDHRHRARRRFDASRQGGARGSPRYDCASGSSLPGVRLWPLMVSGTLIRLEPGEDATRDNMIGAGSLLAIEFTEPLKELEVPAGG